MPNVTVFVPAVLLALVSALTPRLAAAAAPDWWTQSGPATASSSLEIVTPCAPAAAAAADSCVAARTNWIDGWLEVRAEATANRRRCLDQAHCFSVAVKTARHLAYEKLAEVIDGLSLEGSSTYGRELMASSELRTVVKALIRGARELRVDQGTYSDGSFFVGVNLGLPLRGPGSLQETTLRWYLNDSGRVATPAPQATMRPATPACPPVMVAVAPTPPRVACTRPPSPGAGNVGVPSLPRLDERFSGVIIDCSGLGVRPMVFPRIVTPSGRLVYGLGAARDKHVARHGLVDWAPDLASARELKRVGKHPLVVKAIGTGGAGSADIVVTEDAAALIAATVGREDFLGEGSVVISLD